MALPTYLDTDVKCPLDNNNAVALDDNSGNRVVWCTNGHISHLSEEKGWEIIKS